jgi:hypothetical protein
MPMRPSAQHEVMILPSKCLLHSDALALLKTSASCGLPIFLQANHQLESEVPETGLLGSAGGATSSVVPALPNSGPGCGRGKFHLWTRVAQAGDY